VNNTALNNKVYRKHNDCDKSSKRFLQRSQELSFLNNNPRGGGGTLGISGWECAAGTLEPSTYTRATMRDKSVDTPPKNGPFLNSDLTYPLPPVYLHPCPPRSMLYFGLSSLSFTSDNIDSGGEGIYGV